MQRNTDSPETEKEVKDRLIDRRSFLAYTGIAGAALLSSGLLQSTTALAASDEKKGPPKPVHPLDPNAVTTVTISGLRALPTPSTTRAFLVSDAGKEGLFLLDSSDSVSADNGGTVIVSSSGARFKRLVDDAVNVAWFGAIGDGTADDSDAIQSAVNEAIAAGHGEVVFPQTSGFYRVTKSIEIRMPDHRFLHLRGIGQPEIRVTQFTSPDSHMSLFKCVRQTTPSTNAGVMISHLFINGIGVGESWGATNYYDNTQNKILFAVHMEVNQAIVHNCRFENVYGYGINIRYYDFALVDNCTFKSVGGHWYVNDGFDAFGDAVYCAQANSPSATAKVSNCVIVAYPSDRPRLSRIGVTFEFAAYQAVVENCYIEGYDRGIHVEGCPEIDLLVSATVVQRYNVGVFVQTGGKKLAFHHLRIFGNVGQYNGQSGPFATYEITSMPISTVFENCQFEIDRDVGSHLKIYTSFSNTTIVSKGGRWTFVFFKGLFNQCTLIGKCIYMYQCLTDQMNDCRLIGQPGSDQVIEAVAGSTILRLSDCVFENGWISLDNVSAGQEPLLSDCKFYKQAGSTMSYGGFIRPYAATIYINDGFLRSDIPMSFVASGGGTTKFLGLSYLDIAGTLQDSNGNPV
ncbi:right-handed parallel beta-helix repeat-containing protein [Cohnella soli]|uniref:Right-handed parallel beta-helix repeat-containing protein n=1 Tax=Cohnella soli TaxID=425005 RepID=A0ABW0I3F8_9BACL